MANFLEATGIATDRVWKRDHLEWSYTRSPVALYAWDQKAKWEITHGSSTWSGTCFGRFNVNITVLPSWPNDVRLPVPLLNQGFPCFLYEVEQMLRDKRDFDRFYAAKRLEEENRAAIVIQQHWREAVSNPYRPVCQRRMWREFMELRFEDCDRYVSS